MHVFIVSLNAQTTAVMGALVSASQATLLFTQTGKYAIYAVDCNLIGYETVRARIGASYIADCFASLPA